MNNHQDPNEKLDLKVSTPLAVQHLLAMFASNITPAIIIAGAAGYAFGGAEMLYMIQMSMVFAGVATLMQTIGFSKVGARLPIMQGTSFAFVPVMIGIAKAAGMGAVFASTILAGIFHFLLGFVIGKLRHLMPPLVTGLVIISIGLALIPVGVKYAAGGVPLMGKEGFGGLNHWGLALVVIFTTLGIKFYCKGFLSTAAVLIGLLAGYIVAALFGMVSWAKVGSASWFELPMPFVTKFDWNFDMLGFAIIGMCLISLVSAVETVGDISGITKGGANREASNEELEGGTMADGLGSAVAGIFGGLPNTSFSQNVGLIAMTGVMSRHVVTLSGIFLIICGLIPKIGAIISSMPIAVLGGGVIVMFGMVISAGLKMLVDINMNRRNMIIIAVSLSVGLGLQTVPQALQHLPASVSMLLSTGLLPVAVISIALNALMPEESE